MDYYRFSLKKNPTTWYAVTEAGGVKEQTELYKKPDPEGWETTEISDVHNNVYFGYNRMFSGKYKFIAQGALILRHIWYNIGNEAPVFLLVEYLQGNSYVTLFETQIDLKKAKDSRYYFEAPLLEGGIEALIKQNESLTYDIELVPALSAQIMMRPFLVQGKLTYQTNWPVAGATNNNAIGITAAAYKNYLLYGGGVFANVVGGPTNEPISITPSSNNEYVTGQTHELITGGGTYALNSNVMLTAETDLKKVKIEGSIAFNVKNLTGATGKFRLRLNLLDTSNNLLTHFFQVESSNIANNDAQNFALVINPPEFDIPAGYKLIMQHTMQPNGSNYDHNVAWEKDNKIEITFQHYTNEFEIEAIRLRYLAEQLVKRMTDNKATLVSDMLEASQTVQQWLDTIPYTCFITSGDAIRKVKTKGYNYPVVKISFRTLFQFMHSVFNTGMSVEGNKVRIESKKYFFDETKTALNLGDIADDDWSIEQDERILWNILKVGYENSSHDDINGRYEVNASQTYKSPCTYKGELNLVSPIRTDGFGMFKTWVENAINPDKDSETDSTLFAVDAVFNGGTFRPRQWDPGTTGKFTGILDITNTPNIAYSPKHCFYRCGSLIRTGIDKGLEQELITFQSGDKNIELVTDFGVKEISQKASVKVQDLDSPLFRPRMINVKVAVPHEYIEIMRDPTKMYGKIIVRINGTEYAGFAWATGIIPSVPVTHTFKLMVCSTTDLSNLVTTNTFL